MLEALGHVIVVGHRPPTNARGIVRKIFKTWKRICHRPPTNARGVVF